MKRPLLCTTAVAGLALISYPVWGAGQAIPAAEYRRLIQNCQELLDRHEVDTAAAKNLAARLRGVGSVTFPNGQSMPVETKPEADALDAITGTTPDKKLSARFVALNEQIRSGENISRKTDPHALAESILAAKEFAGTKAKDADPWKWEDVRWPDWFKPIGKAIGRFFDSVGKALQKAIDAFFKATGKFFRWLFKAVPKPKFGKFKSFANPANTVLLTLYFLFTVGAIVGCYFLFRYTLERGNGSRKSKLLGGDLDLSSEGITDPLGTAKERAQEGNYRDAIRLTYIASLWRLADSGLLTLEKNRTNWEYQRSLRKRSRKVHDDLIPATRLFDRVWYGKQVATKEEFETVAAIYDKLPSEIATTETTEAKP